MRIAAFLGYVAVSSPMLAADVSVREYRSDDTLLTLGSYTFEGGKTLPLTVGIGSGAFRHPGDPSNVMWTIGDRGPNLTCNEIKAVADFEPAACREVKNGRIYPTLDDPQSFRRDPSSKQNDPRISELMAIGLDRLIVLERTEKTTKLNEIQLSGATDISGTRWDDAATQPTLEQSDVGKVGIVPVGKALRLDTADLPQIVGKTEGMALLGNGALALINDDDFGITGARTQVVVIRGAGIARQ